MRECSRCHAPDERIILRAEACTCDAGPFAPDDDHTPQCHMVGHKVVLDWPFPVILRSRDLVKSADASHGYMLPAKYSKHWKLVERPGHPGQFARVRTLCRTCIIEELGIAERVKEYDRARKKLAESGRPAQEQGFAKLMALQDSL